MARGGYRPNSGPQKGTKYKKNGQESKTVRKKKSIPDDIQKEAKAENLDPLTYMLKVMNDPESDPARRDRMAISAAPYIHSRAGEKGKKKDIEERAKKAGGGRFAASPAPLKVVKKLNG